MSTKVRGYREVILDELAKEEVLKKHQRSHSF